MFALRRRFLLSLLENILTFHVLLRKKLPRKPLQNRPHNRIARRHLKPMISAGLVASWMLAAAKGSY
jgi:hypothetical protein